jgi:uncharacterized phage protein (TIGR02218 family)
MSRTISGPLATHLATGATSLARCVRLDLVDGTSLGMTSFSADLSVDLGDGALTYAADTGVVPSDLSLSLGLEADNVELSGPISEDITRAMVLGGRFRGARVRLFDVRWDAPTQFMPLMSGKVYDARVESGAFVLEVRSAAAAFNQTIGRVLSPYCNADFGDARCGATPQTWAATVASVTDEMTIGLTFVGATPTANDVRNGIVTFTTGGLAGALPVEIFDLSAGVLSLYLPLADLPDIGDALTLKEGCPGLRSSCVEKQGNADNFRGFPDLTGTDNYLKYPVPS